MTDEIFTDSLDEAPVDALEDIFVLPEDIQSDARIVRWHTEMVERLKREAQGVPMKTAQYTLMERISFFYAYMRYQELHNPDMSSREKMANMTAWQSMLDMFNRMLEKHNDKVLRETILEVQAILKDALPIVSDTKERADLRRHLGERFANIGL